MPSSSRRRRNSVFFVTATSLAGWPLRESQRRYAIAFATGFHLSKTGLVVATGVVALPIGEMSVGAALFAQFAPAVTVKRPSAENTEGQRLRSASTFHTPAPDGKLTVASVAAVRATISSGLPAIET